MWFFKIVLQHWVALLITVVYVTVFAKTVNRFSHQVLRGVGYRPQPVRQGVLTKSATFVVLFLFAPLVWHRLKVRDRVLEARRQMQEAEKRRLEAEEFQRHNRERADARKQWAIENRPILYYNTVSGIMAVMTPSAYQACQESTNAHRRNALWTHESSSMPSKAACLFVNATGRRLFSQNHGTADPIENGYVSGWFTDFDELERRYGIKLEHRPDIFVPYVNETILPFDDHRDGLNSRARNYEHDLVIRQMPEHLHPLRRD
jgi:hypothetical protein